METALIGIVAVVAAMIAKHVHADWSANNITLFGIAVFVVTAFLAKKFGHGG